MQNKFPSPIKIACYEIEVKAMSLATAKKEEAYGTFSGTNQLIKISREYCPNVLAVFLHELIHAVEWAYAVDGDTTEESRVDAVAIGFTQIFQDNPDVLRFINGEVKGRK